MGETQEREKWWGKESWRIGEDIKVLLGMKETWGRIRNSDRIARVGERTEIIKMGKESR